MPPLPEIVFAEEEIRRFCINTKGHKPFPKDGSARREFIFGRTGFSAKPMNWREWFCFNTAMNRGLDLGLSEEGGDRTLTILSLIDHALGEVPRFMGMRHMPPHSADSTAGHSKQVMNIVQTVFERSGVTLTPTVNQLRRDALLGAWIHDMGETVFELTTASDMFHMKPEDRTRISEAKDALESKILPFCCQLASMAIEKKQPEYFHEVIMQMRKHALDASAQFRDPTYVVEKIEARITAMQEKMDEIEALPDFPRELTAETKKLQALYHRTEKGDDFLHPFVKTLEAVEGSRYLQRNSAERATDWLARQLSDCFEDHVHLELAADHEIISSIHRAERRLGHLFAKAKTPEERKLATAAAKYTYDSIARQFTPHAVDHVGIAPAIIDRLAPRPADDISILPLDELRTIRTQEMEHKRQHMEKELRQQGQVEPAQRWNRQYLTREEIGAMYRGAADKVGKGFWPTTECLLDFKKTPEIHPVLAREMDKTLSALKGQVVGLGQPQQGR